MEYREFIVLCRGLNLFSQSIVWTALKARGGR